MAEQNQLIEYTKWLFKSVFKLTMLLIVLVFLLVGVIYGYNYFQNLPREQTGYAGLELGMSMPEALYIKGHPNSVVSTEPLLLKGTSSKFYRVYALKELADRKESEQDYYTWQYELDSETRISIYFDDEKSVNAIFCFSKSLAVCPSLLNIRDGHSENRIKSYLGSPDKANIDPDSGVKTIEYEHFNVRFYLKKKTVYRLGVIKSGSMPL